MSNTSPETLEDLLAYRFGDGPDVPALDAGEETLTHMAARRSHRRYLEKPVDPDLLDTLCAVALSSPTKSDLQQRDIIVLTDGETRDAVDALFAPGSWMATAPVFLVFCANNRRQRQVSAWRGREFANDHLDAFFNVTVDAAIALATFVTAAEAVGLGCCPISELRNHCKRVCRALDIPDHVFPIAGMTLGWPSQEHEISPRLPLSVTVHRDRFSDDGIREQIDAYDHRRHAIQPYANQRFADRFGEVDFYGWSEDKARQYAETQRADFGAFVRAKGFNLK